MWVVSPTPPFSFSLSSHITFLSIAIHFIICILITNSFPLQFHPSTPPFHICSTLFVFHIIDFFWQVVKAFITLADGFKDREPEELKKELQDHVKNVTAPYKYPRQVRDHSNIYLYVK